MAGSEEKQTDLNFGLSTNAKYIWIAGAIILLIAGWFAMKAILGSFETYRVSLVDAPKEVSAGSNFAFTWRIDGPPTTINHTAVHMGLESTPGELGTDVKPQDTKYTDFVKDFANGKYDIPLQFVGNMRLEKEGKYYFRVHALIKNKNYWSDEYTFEVKKPDYSISIIQTPTNPTAGRVITFTWRIDGPTATTTSNTTIYYGLTSTPGKLGKEVNPKDTTYTDYIKDFVGVKTTIPLQFVGNTKIASPGSYFMRGYALINGLHYWTDEFKLDVGK